MAMFHSVNTFVSMKVLQQNLKVKFHFLIKKNQNSYDSTSLLIFSLASVISDVFVIFVPHKS
jgi:hypothetical protein